MNSQEILDELKREVPSAIVANDAVFLLETQTPRSRANIYKAIKILAEKFPKKKIAFFNAGYKYISVEPHMDRNVIKIAFLSAPNIDGVAFHSTGTTPDNMQEDGKIVHGKSAIMINGSWLSLTRGQRQTFVEMGSPSQLQKDTMERMKNHRIFAENPVELGFAIHNQIHIFSNIFDSTANAGEILHYVVEKAAEKMSFDFADGLKPEQMAEYIFGLKTAGYRLEMAQLEKYIQQLEKNAESYLNAYIGQIRERETANQTLAGLTTGQANKENTIKRISDEIRELIELKKYVEFYVERDATGNPIFCAVTNRVFLVHKNMVYDFRYYTVKIKIRGGAAVDITDVWFDNPEINVNGRNHPHSEVPMPQKAGKVCWGNMQAEIGKMCGMGDVTKILDACHAFLNSYSERNPFLKIELFGIKPVPLAEFNNRRPDDDDYKKHKSGEDDSLPVNGAPDQDPMAEALQVLHRILDDGRAIPLGDLDLVCERCGSEEENCECADDVPLIRRELFRRQ